MKYFFSNTLSIMLCFFALSCASETEKKELQTETEKVSYALGLDIGASLKQLDSEIDLASLYQGIKDTLTSAQPLMSKEEHKETMQRFAVQRQEKFQQEMQEKAKTNIKEADEFLEENKQQEDVMTTESGLQYKVLEEGDGPKPEATDQVKVHYKGTLIDGTEFDSSYKRGQPAVFKVNEVIPGWTEALQLMSVGSKYKLFIPPQLGYGERQAGQIPPNSTLIFEVELLEIVE